jgi:hypothetical protein
MGDKTQKKPDEASRADLARRLLNLLGPKSDIDPAEVEAILRPTGGATPVDEANPAKLVCSNRETLQTALLGGLVGDQLARLLKGADREAIESELNRPFPPRSAITVEFLDQLVKRIQMLETQNRLLASVLLEIVFPLDCQPNPDACVSSNNRDDR